MGLGGVAIATLPSVIFPKLMFSDRLGGDFSPPPEFCFFSDIQPLTSISVSN